MKIEKTIGILIVATLLLLPVVLAVSNNSKVPESKGSKEPLEKIEFIHWKKGFAKPPCDYDGICEPELGENPSCADCKETEGSTTTCYAFLGKYGRKYLKWTSLPVNYLINPTNSQLNESFVATAVYNAAEEWDAHTTRELMNNYTIDYTATYGVQDYKNAISFGNYPTEGVIAVTSVWYNPATKEIVEFDIMFDTDWQWGDATINTTVMDLQNIATHEFGHGIGLADVYDTACSEVTMYGYSDYGETEKRTLEQPDITGLQTLYGA